MLTPVMYRLSSEARKAHASATSAGWPILPSGIREVILLITFSGTASVIGVAMNPGSTQLQRIPNLLSSLAAVLVNPSTPALEAE
uniref:Uncharacterized protein n=1 Tax=Anguilla anguilla TaxID=7936 RepID=A0A0E9UJS5_ANGAN